MHLETDKISVKKTKKQKTTMLICSKSLILLCHCMSMNHQWASALEKDIELIWKSISGKGKGDQYPCMRHRWDIVQILNLNVRNIIWISSAQKYCFKLEYIYRIAIAVSTGLDYDFTNDIKVVWFVELSKSKTDVLIIDMFLYEEAR